jgi:hypothetical protein
MSTEHTVRPCGGAGQASWPACQELSWTEPCLEEGMDKGIECASQNACKRTERGTGGKPYPARGLFLIGNIAFAR